MYKGIFFSHDPGGTNALIPIVKALVSRGDIQCLNFAASYAVPLWQKSGLDFQEISLNRNEDAEQLLAAIDPDFVFTGTSEDTLMEGFLWCAARKSKIETYSVIDHWTRYKERYMVGGIFMPTDIVFTLDENSKTEMISLGFPPDSVIACGQPHFEKYQNYQSSVPTSEFRSSLGISRQKIILFVSDIISISFPPTAGTAPLGFDEHSTLNELLDKLEQHPDLKKEVEVIIKLHPKEPFDNYSKLLKARQTTIPCHVVKQADNLELVFHSDFVIGMFSMLLFEAYLMQKPVLSIQLNAANPTNYGQHKISVITDRAELTIALTRFLQNKQPASAPTFASSSKCIAQTIIQRLA